LAASGPVIVDISVDITETPELILISEKQAPLPEKDPHRDLDLAFISEKVREMIQGMTERSEKD
jgi:hypothetical protein